jgi:hypothetical protein
VVNNWYDNCCSKNEKGSSMCFFVLVDSGNKQLLKQTQLFDISDDLAATPVFCYLVSSFDADNVAELDGFDELSLVDVFKDLQAQVVQREDDFSQIRLLLKSNENSLRNILLVIGTTNWDLGKLLFYFLFLWVLITHLFLLIVPVENESECESQHC